MDEAMVAHGGSPTQNLRRHDRFRVKEVRSVRFPVQRADLQQGILIFAIQGSGDTMMNDSKNGCYTKTIPEYDAYEH